MIIKFEISGRSMRTLKEFYRNVPYGDGTIKTIVFEKWSEDGYYPWFGCEPVKMDNKRSLYQIDTEKEKMTSRDILLIVLQLQDYSWENGIQIKLEILSPNLGEEDSTTWYVEDKITELKKNTKVEEKVS